MPYPSGSSAPTESAADKSLPLPTSQELISRRFKRFEETLIKIAESMRNSSPAMANLALPGPVDYAQIPALAERGLARLQRFFETLNERLADREFVATDRFSIVDITAAVAVDFARVVKVKPGEAHPELLRWRAGLAARPSMSL